MLINKDFLNELGILISMSMMTPTEGLKRKACLNGIFFSVPPIK